MKMLPIIATLCLFPLLAPPAPAQQQPAQQPQAEKKAPVVQAPAARLASAKNVLIIRSRGGDIPYETIRTTIEGWERFTLVNAPEKADLIIEVASVGGDTDVHVASGFNPSPETGRFEPSTRSGKDVSATEITLTVADARNKRVLWHGTESAKFAVRQKTRENNLVEAAEKLASRFHDRLEPPLAR
jgi:hypothetical protein